MLEAADDGAEVIFVGIAATEELKQLNVIDDEEIESTLFPGSPGIVGQGLHVGVTHAMDEERRPPNFGAGEFQPCVLVFAQGAGRDDSKRHTRLSGEYAIGDGERIRFEGEDADGAGLAEGGVAGECEGEARSSLIRPAADHHEVAGSQASRESVDRVQAGADLVLLCLTEGDLLPDLAEARPLPWAEGSWRRHAMPLGAVS